MVAVRVYHVVASMQEVVPGFISKSCVGFGRKKLHLSLKQEERDTWVLWLSQGILPWFLKVALHFYSDQAANGSHTGRRPAVERKIDCPM